MDKYGFIKDIINPSEHYIFGDGQLAGLPLNPTGQWNAYLPADEVQNLNGIEPYACASFGTLNAIEALLRFHFGATENFSDRFLAKISGTAEKKGNSPHTVAEFQRKVGAVLENEWPFDQTITSFDAFYASIPQSVMNKARTFLDEYDFGHDWVPTTPANLKAALSQGTVCVSVSAWYQNSDGLYYCPKDVPNNHWCMVYGYEDGKYWKVFDSYDNTHKRLVWDFPFELAKRYTITVKEQKQLDLIGQILDLIQKAIQALFPKPEPTPVQPQPTPQTPPVAPQEAPGEAIAAEATKWLGKDASPQNLAPQEVSCAEGVSNILHQWNARFPKAVLSTADLDFALTISSLFKSTRTQKKGCVIVSPRTDSTYGHAGIFIDDTHIASNDSRTGRFEKNYTMDSWVKEMRDKRGLHIYLYEPK